MDVFVFGPEGNPYNDMVTYFINPFGKVFPKLR